MTQKIINVNDAMNELVPVISLIPTEYHFLLENSIRNVLTKYHNDLVEELSRIDSEFDK